MAVRYDDIGHRLKAFRMGSGLSAEEVARQAGISRTALYRSERGELVKLDTLEKLADLLGVSITTLLGVGIEYIASAVSYFERLRQIEETAEHITHIAGPISFLLASPAFERTLNLTLRESVPEDLPERDRVFADIDAHHGGAAGAQGDVRGAPALHREPDVGAGDRSLRPQRHGRPLRFA